MPFKHRDFEPMPKQRNCSTKYHRQPQCLASHEAGNQQHRAGENHLHRPAARYNRYARFARP
jgi:hypothetical protein